GDAGDDGVEAGLAAAPPFDMAVGALDARPLARRPGHHVLYAATSEARLGAERHQAETVVVDPAVAHHVEHRLHLDDAAAPAQMREVLPQVGRVGMLPGRPTSPFRETQIALPRPGEPRMRGEYSAPVLAELDVDRRNGAEPAGCDDLAGGAACPANHVIVADEDGSSGTLRLV